MKSKPRNFIIVNKYVHILKQGNPYHFRQLQSEFHFNSFNSMKKRRFQLELKSFIGYLYFDWYRVRIKTPQCQGQRFPMRIKLNSAHLINIHAIWCLFIEINARSSIPCTLLSFQTRHFLFPSLYLSALIRAIGQQWKAKKARECWSIEHFLTENLIEFALPN